MAQLTVADGTQYTIALLGRSADALSIAVRLGDSDATLWVDRWEIERWEIGNGRYLDSLPIYIGAVAGRWEPWLQQDGDRLEVEVYYFWTSTLAARPNGPQLAWRLPTDMYPVLGHSLDAQWLALRVETLEPPVVWMPIDGQQLDFEPADLPIFLSAGLEVVEIGSDGRASVSIFAAEPLVEPEHRREWRNNRELLLHDSDKGTWLWDVERNEIRKLSDHWLANISPDGAFTVRHFQIDSTAAANPQAPSHVALVSLDDGDEVAFESVYKPWGNRRTRFPTVLVGRLTVAAQHGRAVQRRRTANAVLRPVKTRGTGRDHRARGPMGVALERVARHRGGRRDAALPQRRRQGNRAPVVGRGVRRHCSAIVRQPRTRRWLVAHLVCAAISERSPADRASHPTLG